MRLWRAERLPPHLASLPRRSHGPTGPSIFLGTLRLQRGGGGGGGSPSQAAVQASDAATGSGAGGEQHQRETETTMGKNSVLHRNRGGGGWGGGLQPGKDSRGSTRPGCSPGELPT